MQKQRQKQQQQEQHERQKLFEEELQQLSKGQRRRLRARLRQDNGKQPSYLVNTTVTTGSGLLSDLTPKAMSNLARNITSGSTPTMPPQLLALSKRPSSVIQSLGTTKQFITFTQESTSWTSTITTEWHLGGGFRGPSQHRIATAEPRRGRSRRRRPNHSGSERERERCHTATPSLESESGGRARTLTPSPPPELPRGRLRQVDPHELVKQEPDDNGRSIGRSRSP